jgi:hypothetical protein
LPDLEDRPECAGSKPDLNAHLFFIASRVLSDSLIARSRIESNLMRGLLITDSVRSLSDSLIARPEFTVSVVSRGCVSLEFSVGYLANREPRPLKVVVSQTLCF